MEFAVATVAFWEAAGFSTSQWRKSVDGHRAIVHLPFAEALVPGIRMRKEVAVYLSPSEAFTSLLSSAEWGEADAGS